MKYWEIVAGNLAKQGWSWGIVTAKRVDDLSIFVADAHRNGKRFIVRGDDLLTVFLELENAVGNYD